MTGDSKPTLSRRALLAAAGALAAPLPAEPLTGGVKLTMPGRDLSDDWLRFIKQLAVEWVTTGGPGAPTYSPEGRVILPPGVRAEPPWKDAELRAMQQRVESHGLKLGNLMLHDFRDVILGRP